MFRREFILVFHVFFFVQVRLFYFIHFFQLCFHSIFSHFIWHVVCITDISFKDQEKAETFIIVRHWSFIYKCEKLVVAGVARGSGNIRSAWGNRFGVIVQIASFYFVSIALKEIIWLNSAKFIISLNCRRCYCLSEDEQIWCSNTNSIFNFVSVAVKEIIYNDLILLKLSSVWILDGEKNKLNTVH